jgi:hypothetical protein
LCNVYAATTRRPSRLRWLMPARKREQVAGDSLVAIVPNENVFAFHVIAQGTELGRELCVLAEPPGALAATVEVLGLVLLLGVHK